MQLKTIAAGLTAAALLAPGAASAHVTLQPKEVAAGGFTRLDVRVPTESDDASTTKVSVKMPPGFIFASYEAYSGWKTKIVKRKLAEPVEAFGEQQTEEVDTITWTADSKADGIAPGQFKDFGLSVGVPEGKAGSQLKFPSTQTYSNGEVVRWIGAEDAEKPAPLVTLTAAEGAHGGAAATEETAAETAAPPASQVSQEDVDDKASKGLATGALIVGALGLIVGIAGFAASRRRVAA